MTTIKDLVLIFQDNTPCFFARVEALLPDIKPNWWNIYLQIIELDTDNKLLPVIIWTLHEDYVNGSEFTMGGIPMRIDKIPSYSQEELVEETVQTTVNEKKK